jgi:hypothetical protein
VELIGRMLELVVTAVFDYVPDFRCCSRSLSDCSCRRRISARLGVGRWALRLSDLAVAQLPLEHVIFQADIASGCLHRMEIRQASGSPSWRNQQ